MTEKEFRHWIQASHYFIEIFWGGYGEYSIGSRWVDEWFDFGEFIVRQEDEEVLLNSVKEHDYPVLETAVQQHLREGKQNNVGFACAPYLFTWNIMRFQEYLKRNRSFSQKDYFESLGGFIQLNQSRLEHFRNSNLLLSEIDEGVTTIFEETNEKMSEIGIGQNEPVGTAKILHILAPYYFPLIDNAIAEKVGLKMPRETLTSEDYKEWMIRMKKWLSRNHEAVDEMQEKFNMPILKLVDEGLYLMCTVYNKLPYKVSELEL